jgi:hypothetical protein
MERVFMWGGTCRKMVVGVEEAVTLIQLCSVLDGEP